MKKKLVIIGGGFAGGEIARLLDKDENFEITLIDSKNYFEFTPSILRVITHPDYMEKIHILHKDYLKKSRIVVGKVVEIDNKKVYVKTQKKKEVFQFDYLVICSGSSYAFPFKGQDTILPVRAESLKKNYSKLKKAKKIILVGGGLVGVEIAGEITDNYKIPDEKEIVLIHSKQELIERNNKKARDYARKILEKKGVKIIFEDRVVKRSEQICFTEKKNKIAGDLVFSCVGIMPNFDFMKKNFINFLDEKNHILVDEFLRLNNGKETHKNIFAAGDITSINEEKTAQNAEKQARVVVKNLKNENEKKNKIVKYVSSPRILVISLGKFNGILTYKNFTLTGLIPAFLKKYIEVYTMMKYKR